MNRRHKLQSVGFLLAIVLCAARVWAQSEVGTVAAAVGTLQIQRAAAWQDGGVGAPIFVGDRLRTGATNSVKIVFRDDSVLDVAPNTELTVDKQTFDSSAQRFDTLLRLLKGKVRAWVSEYYQQPHARYQIETPTAIAGVRGTEFIIVYEADTGATDVVGLAGKVDVAGRSALLGSKVQVEPGFFSRVEKGREPTAPQQLDDARLRQYLTDLDIIGTGRPDGLNVQHAAMSGRLLTPQDLPSDVAKGAIAGGIHPQAPSGFLADRKSPDIATNTQPLLDFRNTPPGQVPVGGVHVGF